jgi:hypothetical protein
MSHRQPLPGKHVIVGRTSSRRRDDASGPGTNIRVAALRASALRASALRAWWCRCRAARRGPRTAVCPCIGRMAVACDVRSTPIVQKGQTAAAVSFVGCLHLPLVDLLGVRGGLRCVARCWWIRPGRGWVKSPEERATNRGRKKAHPATGGAGRRRRGRSAAHKMASTSSNNSTTSWSRRTRSRSDMSLQTGMAATLVCVITTPRLVQWPIRR